MSNKLSAKVNRPLVDRRGKTVVDIENELVLFAYFRYKLHIDHFQCRVGWCFNKDHSCIGSYRFFPFFWLSGTDISIFDTISWKKFCDHSMCAPKNSIA